MILPSSQRPSEYAQVSTTNSTKHRKTTSRQSRKKQLTELVRSVLYAEKDKKRKERAREELLKNGYLGKFRVPGDLASARQRFFKEHPERLCEEMGLKFNGEDFGVYSIHFPGAALEAFEEQKREIKQKISGSGKTKIITPKTEVDKPAAPHVRAVSCRCWLREAACAARASMRCSASLDTAGVRATPAGGCGGKALMRRLRGYAGTELCHTTLKQCKCAAGRPLCRGRMHARSERARVPPPCPLHPRCTMPGTEGTLGASWGAAPGARLRVGRGVATS